MSKAFDRVWHAGLIHKLKAAGITGQLLDWFVTISKIGDREWLFLVYSLTGFISQLGCRKALYISDIVNDIGCNNVFLSLLKILTLQLNLLIQTWVKYQFGLENG